MNWTLGRNKTGILITTIIIHKNVAIHLVIREDAECRSVNVMRLERGWDQKAMTTV